MIKLDINTVKDLEPVRIIREHFRNFVGYDNVSTLTINSIVGYVNNNEVFK